MPLGRAARAAAAVALVAVLGGCTPPGAEEPSPTPTPGPDEQSPRAVVPEAPGERIAVIVPPQSVVAPAEGAALARAARRLAEDLPPGVAEVRVARATSEAFVRDLANLAVDDGYDVVCVVGTGTAELALQLARARRDARFCTTDGRIAGGPVNLVAVAIDPAALVEAGAVAIGTASAPVGFLASAQLGDVEALTAAFTSTVAPPRQDVVASPSPDAGATGTRTPGTSPSPSPSPSPPPAAPQPAFVTAAPGTAGAAQVSAAEELATTRPSRVLVLATPGGSGAAAALGGTGAELVVVADWSVDPQGEGPTNLLVALTVDWEALLVGAVEAARTPDAPQVQLQGIDAGVLGARPGQAPEAPAATDRTIEHLRRSAE